MNTSFLFVAALAAAGAFFEHQQHKDYSAKYPDAPETSPGTLGFIILAVICGIFAFTGGFR